MKRCIRCVVSGRVQGVWFRSGAREKALALGLNGHARNLDDGRVEVLACGDESELEALQAWLWMGTPLSRVTEVNCEAVTSDVPPDFVTK